MRILVPTGAALTLLAVVTGSAHRVDHDLHLVAPEHAVPGQSLPVRAQLYAGLHRTEGAELITPAVSVELHASNGRVLARGRLRPSYAHSMDAMLALPADYAGEARLTARARVDTAAPSSERTLRIGERASGPPLSLHDRPLAPLQRFAPGPVRAANAELHAPDALALSIGSGACVPEQPCELLLHVGSPAAAVRLLATGAVTPAPESARLSAPTDGVVRLQAITHGPEAEAQIVAERDGVQVATRSFRLAVALGASVLRAPPRVLDAPALPAVGLRGDERGCIVDAFLDQRWVRTGSLRDCRGREPLPFAALEPGLWRLQLRRDPFEADSAAVYDLYVRRPGESAAEVLARLTSAVLELAPDDALARAVRGQPDAYAASFDLAATYLLARLDAGIVALPAAVSGYPMAMLRLEVARGKLRKLALLVLGLCALSLGLLVAQRGLTAASEANRLMAQAGEEPRQLERQRLRMTLRVLATVTSLLLAFLAIAVYMLARS